MICQNCEVPMETLRGSENGKMSDEYYFTQEVKRCPLCKRTVKESYEAKLVEVPEKIIKT